jgi:dsRNA-specific ribonuclease
MKNKLNLIFKYSNLIKDENLNFKDFLNLDKKEKKENFEKFKFDHYIKIICVKESKENHNFSINNNFCSYNIDYEEINLILETVKSDINNYHYFLVNYICINREKFFNFLDDPDLIDKEIKDKKFNKNRELVDKKIHTICRNFINFSKTYVYTFSCEKSRKGENSIPSTKNILLRNLNVENNSVSMSLSENENENNTISEEISVDTYQKDYLVNFGLLIQGDCEFLKTFSLDFNQRMLKYKLNLKNLGRVHKKSKAYYIKRFTFLPKEILHEIKNITIDQIFLYGLFPMILYKLQNDLFYYYQARCLKNRFNFSFGELKQFKMNLLIEALNSKSTMESQNYERLEFLGDSVLKFLSSFEVFADFPNCNRDLLYSKRRVIESNKNLFAKSIDENNLLQKFLYTSPISFKRFNIKGFETDEVFLFNIGNNRSFSKKNLDVLFKKNIGMNINDNNGDNNYINYKIQNYEDLSFNNDYKNENDKVFKSKCQNDYFIEENSEADKTLMGVDKYLKKTGTEKEKDNFYLDTYENDNQKLNNQNINDTYNNNDNINNKIEESDLINTDELELFVKNNLQIKSEENKTRIIGNKVLADFIESLVGYLFHMDFISQNENFFNLSSKFLTEIGVLKKPFDLKSSKNFWLENLDNIGCKFSKEQKLNRFLIIDNENFHCFQNKDLLYQAMTHPEYINDMNFNYVNKSYQRLAFLGEAFLSFVVAFYVYDNNPNINECMLHKLKICGINHHVVSSVAIKMNLHDLLLIK